jgi:hypothetical protein
MVSCFTNTSAEGINYYKYKNFKYTDFDYKSVAIKYYIGKKAKAVVPTKIKGKKVVLVNLTRAKGLKQIRIPRYVKFIDLAGNRSLVKVTISKKNKNFSVKNNMILNKKKTKLVSVLGGYEEIRIPETVKTVNGYSFFRSKVKKVIITKNVKLIEDGAFYRSNKLKKIVFEGNTIPKFEWGSLGYTNDKNFYVKNKKLAKKLLKELKGKVNVYAHIYVGKKLFCEKKLEEVS